PAISAATARAASRNRSVGTTSSTVPYATNCAAGTLRQVYTIVRINCCGTSRAKCVAAPSAPRSTSGSPNVASSLATTKSALPTSPTPPPRQNPCTAATTGTAHSYTAANAAKQPRFAPTSASYPSVRCISLMSTPAQNPRPFAASTTARTSVSCPAAINASARSNQPCTGNAFTGG